MLITIIVWLYMVFLCYAYGILFLRFVRSFLGAQDEYPEFSIILVCGIILLTTLSSTFSLFSKIGLYVNILLVLGALVIYWKKHVSIPVFHLRSVLKLSSIIFVLAFLIVLENSTHRSINSDTNLYHAQAIRWIESYPAVPGLGNLHGRLAFNSAWFITNALFSFSFIGGRSLHLVSGFFFLIFYLFCWPGFQAILSGKISLSALLKTALIPLSFALLGGEISSPGTDLPATLFIWLLVILAVEQFEQPRPYHVFLITIISIFALTIKLSTAPVLLLSSIFILQEIFRKEKRMIFLLLTSSLGVLAPFLIRNVILSGYLLYPFPAIDIFGFDWKVQAGRAVNERLAIQAWARLPGLDSTEVLSMPIKKWFPLWLARQTINRRGIFFAVFLSPIAIIPLRWIGLLQRKNLWVWLASYAGACFWFFSAPDFRFGYGFLISTILCVSLPWFTLEPISKYFNKYFSALLASLFLVFMIFTLVSSFEARTISTRILWPVDYDHVPTKVCDIANATVFCAQSYNACSYADFPCIPDARRWVQMRGAGWESGFRAIP